MRVNLKPVVTELKLECDPEGLATVTVRQATTGDTVRRGELFSKTARVWDDAEVGQVKLEQDWNVHEQRRFEAYLTIVGVTHLVDEDDKPIFKVRETPDGPRLNMNQHEFNRAWDALPVEITSELHRHVLTVNPQWSPNAQGE